LSVVLDHRCLRWHTLTVMKNPVKSLTIWGLVLAALANLLEPLGLTINVGEVHGLVEQFIEIYPEILETLGLILAFIGRIRANQPISFTGK